MLYGDGLLFSYLFDPTDLTVLKADLDATGVGGGSGQDVFDYPFGCSSGTLVFL